LYTYGHNDSRSIVTMITHLYLVPKLMHDNKHLFPRTHSWPARERYVYQTFIQSINQRGKCKPPFSSFLQTAIPSRLANCQRRHLYHQHFGKLRCEQKVLVTNFVTASCPENNAEPVRITEK
jgi:hypothetical protein